MNSNIFNSIILSNEQVNYLMGGTAGINRLSCLYQLIQIVTRQIETSNEVGECGCGSHSIRLAGTVSLVDGNIVRIDKLLAVNNPC